MDGDAINEVPATANTAYVTRKEATQLAVNDFGVGITKPAHGHSHRRSTTDWDNTYWFVWEGAIFCQTSTQ